MAKGIARKLLLRAGRNSRRSFNRMMTGSSLVGDPAVFDPATFGWIAGLEARVDDIRAELLRIMERRDLLPAIEEISPDHARIARERRWRSFFLHAYGYRSDVACNACPITASLVDAIPNLETAFFSVLAPGAHLPPHRGVTKALVTCHLPLLVPDTEDCWIRVETEYYRWRPGRAFVFDDTRLHEVRNGSGDYRVVLLIHVRRPLRLPGSLAGNAFMAAVKRSPFITDGIRNQQAWEQIYVREAQAPGSARPALPMVDPVIVGDGQTGRHAGEGVVVHHPARESFVEHAPHRGNQAGPAGAQDHVDVFGR